VTETALTGAATAPGAPPATSPAAAAPVPTPPPAAAPAAQSTDTTDWKAETEKWKALARKHEAQAKANVAAASTAEEQKANLAKVAAALGLNIETTDPAAITAQLQAAQAAERARSTELAVLRAASRLDADGDALLDSRAFLAGIADLDPNDPAAITDAIKAAVAANPKFARAATGAAPAAAPPQRQTSGGQYDGAPGGNRQWTADDIARATPAQMSEAMSKGLLQQYMAS